MTEETPTSKAQELLLWIRDNPEEIHASVRKEANDLVAKFTGNEGWLEFVKTQETVVRKPTGRTGAELRSAMLEIIRFVEMHIGG